ncbi:MAG: Lacal_2735 family protein [bacterium]|nr:Lacal_2735 family protein [bacterium]
MIKLFKKKSKKEKLNDQYMKLLEESRRMSTSNRTEADRIMAEAEKVLDKIKAIEANEANGATA